MKKVTHFILILASLPLMALAQNPKATISVSNPSKVERKEAIVAVKWEAIVAKYPGIDTSNFKVLSVLNKKEVPFQLERLGEGKVQNLLLQVSLKANEVIKLILVQGKPLATAKKTYARHVPERYDDFAWENDKVAFRMYGKALESRNDNAYGTDVWVKKTTKLVIDEWYKSGDYHKDHGDGMDYYSVGFTLGAGDIAPFVKDSIYFSKNYHHWKVLDNGPLRSTFELGYDAWSVAGKLVKVVKRISLDAGSHMNKIEVQYSYDGGDELPVAIGIIKRKEAGSIIMDERKGIMAYWEPQHGEDGITGVATITVGGNLGMGTHKNHLMTQGKVKAGQPLVYYNGSAWSKANEITTDQEWFEYLDNYKLLLKQPLQISVQ